jgi:hypothetical protein
MAAKEVKFAGDARDRMLHGIDILADAVRVTRHRRIATPYFFQLPGWQKINGAQSIIQISTSYSLDRA